MIKPKQNNDTTEEKTGGRPLDEETKHPPQNYYDDDATGYELYQPTQTDEDGDDENGAPDGRAVASP